MFGSFLCHSFSVILVLFVPLPSEASMSSSQCDVMVGEPLNRDVVHPVKSFPQEAMVPTHITIFDYDDTILPSSWLTCIFSAREELSQDMVEKLKKVDQTASTLLREALKYSTVIIVTNAEEGWVEYSSRLFLPTVFGLLHYVTVRSARSRYAARFPEESGAWKKMTFSDELDPLWDHNGSISVLSIGDSLLERDAVFSYEAANSGVIAKSIKMIDVPNPTQLSMQQQLICRDLYKMVARVKKLDLKLTAQSSV